MNEYDSSKWLDLLEKPTAILLTDNAVKLIFSCLIPVLSVKSAGKKCSTSSDAGKTKDVNPTLLSVSEEYGPPEEGDFIRRRAPLADIVFGPQTLTACRR